MLTARVQTADRIAGLDAGLHDLIWRYGFGPGSKNLTAYLGCLRRKADLPGRP